MILSNCDFMDFELWVENASKCVNCDFMDFELWVENASKWVENASAHPVDVGRRGRKWVAKCVRKVGRKWVERGVENGLLLLLEMVFKGFLGDNVISVRV